MMKAIILVLKQMLIGLILLFDVTIVNSQAHDMSENYVPPSDPLVVQNLSKWQDLKFGFFMHWGIYSQWGIIESWSLSPEDFEWNKRTGPYADNYFTYKQAYENLQTTFNPSGFNPEIWAEAAKDAGMKYVVFTTKHHDGFCMFDTKETDYKVTSPKTPFSISPRSNVAKEVFEAFRKNDFMIGAYFSKPDWHNENYWWSYFPPKDRNPNYSLSKYPDRWENFKRFTFNQIKELMTDYGKIDILWLDGGWVRPPEQDINMGKIAEMARQNQPGLIIVDRTVPGEYENYVTPEQTTPDNAMIIPWETCMTMGDSWPYKPNDNYKSTHKLIDLLTGIVCKGGNFLLDVGPKPNGELPSEALERMKEIGEWMKVNGEAIYATRPIQPYEEGQVRFTRKADAVYAIYMTKTENDGLPEEIKFRSLKPKAGSKIYLLGQEKPLRWQTGADGETVITIPRALMTTPPCRHAFSFRFILDGK